MNGSRRPAVERSDDKRAETTSDPPHAQPVAAEAESARLLANEALPQLLGGGLSEDDVRRLADEYIALGLGEGTPEFIRWAREHLDA